MGFSKVRQKAGTPVTVADVHMLKSGGTSELLVSQVEQNIENVKSQKAEQKAKLDRLRGTSDTDNKQ